MKKTIGKACLLFLSSVFAAALFLTPSFPRISAAEAQAGRAVITLSAPFSADGMAAEITRSYGSVLQIPEGTAALAGEEIPVATSVEYLGSGGWTEYALAESRRLVVGEVPGLDRNRTAVYKITYAAGKGESRTELVYTVWAGLEMFLTTAEEMTAFVGDTLSPPECRPAYKYKDPGGTTRYIDIAARTETVFYPADGGQSASIDSGALTLGAAGLYEFTFFSPDRIEYDDVTYIAGSVLKTVRLNVYPERSDPISGAEGVYVCGYEIGGTSETGIGMVRSSCLPTVEIEKRGGVYYLYFTMTAAGYMDGLSLTQNGLPVAGITVREWYAGAELFSATAFVLDGSQLKTGFDVRLNVVPMSRIVNFTIKAELEDAYYAKASNSTAAPALLPAITAADFGGAAIKTGSYASVPSFLVDFSGAFSSGYTVILEGAGVSREGVTVADGSFAAEKTGVYTVRYFALIAEGGVPYAVAAERSVTVTAEEPHTEDGWQKPWVIAVSVAVFAAAIGALFFLQAYLKRRTEK